MRGQSSWSYAPYRPLVRDGGNIYICRVVPQPWGIHLEWLGEKREYKVYCGEKGNCSLVGSTEQTYFDIEGLTPERDYVFYVESEGDKSDERLARVGENEGVVVNYLHPEDMAYAFSGNYLASPSLVKLSEQTWLASMDVYGKACPQNLTLIYRTDDGGKNWKYVSELLPCFWGKLFLWKDRLYMFGCSTEYGDLLIGYSDDEGKTFSAPTVIARGSGGKNGCSGFHRAPQNILIHNGRLYTSYEWGAWSNREYCHAAGVLWCEGEDDLMRPENWHLTPPTKFCPQWVPEMTDVTPTTATIEGTVCVDPKGEIKDVLRFECDAPKALMYRMESETGEQPLQFDKTISFPANHSKFIIKLDEVSGKYYSVATRYFENGVRTQRGRAPRNLLSLLVSEDLEMWRVATDLIDYTHKDINEFGFQYVDFEFDGEDLVFLCRTSMNGAKNFHDANYITFHRLSDFRKY